MFARRKKPPASHGDAGSTAAISPGPVTVPLARCAGKASRGAGSWLWSPAPEGLAFGEPAGLRPLRARILHHPAIWERNTRSRQPNLKKLCIKATENLKMCGRT